MCLWKCRITRYWSYLQQLKGYRCYSPADTSCIGTSSVDASAVHRDENWDARDGRVWRWEAEGPPRDWRAGFRCSNRRRPDTARHLQSQFTDTGLDRFTLNDVRRRRESLVTRRRLSDVRFNYFFNRVLATYIDYKAISRLKSEHSN